MCTLIRICLVWWISSPIYRTVLYLCKITVRLEMTFNDFFLCMMMIDFPFVYWFELVWFIRNITFYYILQKLNFPSLLIKHCVFFCLLCRSQGDSFRSAAFIYHVFGKKRYYFIKLISFYFFISFGRPFYYPVGTVSPWRISFSFYIYFTM